MMLIVMIVLIVVDVLLEIDDIDIMEYCYDV